MSFVDLHCHSTASDGSLDPADVVKVARQAGVSAMSLTDHDTTAGWAAAEAAALRHGIALVRGAELSCRAEGTSVHLLAYLHDPADAGLLAEADRVRTSREGRAQEMVRRLSARFPLTWADVLAQTGPDATVGRPHIADALVAAGVLPDRSAAFTSLLTQDSPYYVQHYATDLAEAVRLVLAAGGVPVMAHPGASSRGRVLSDAAIRAAADAGLVGLEVHHRDHAPDQVARLTALAAELGLLVTGSSDYHGLGKPNLLGEHTTAPDVLAAIVERGRLPVVGP